MQLVLRPPQIVQVITPRRTRSYGSPISTTSAAPSRRCARPPASAGAGTDHVHPSAWRLPVAHRRRADARRGHDARRGRCRARGVSERPRCRRLLTRDEVYDALHARSAGTAAPAHAVRTRRDGAGGRRSTRRAEVGDLPFKVRPGLVAEILRFYDQLRRQSQQVKRFEELITEALGGGDLDDRGAVRLLRQTHFLARTFRGYEQRAAGSDAVDEHRLRERLLCGAGRCSPLAHVIVTVPDWIADPPGCSWPTSTCSAACRTCGDRHRVNRGQRSRPASTNAWTTGGQGSKSSRPATCSTPEPRVRPMLVVPEPTADLAPLWFTHRDREEELIVGGTPARRGAAVVADRVAVVFKRPLPYLYLAPDTLGAAGVPYVVSDALPLAAEPAVATVDLVLDALEAEFRAGHDRRAAPVAAPGLRDTAWPRASRRAGPRAQRRAIPGRRRASRHAV